MSTQSKSLTEFVVTELIAKLRDSTVSNQGRKDALSMLKGMIVNLKGERENRKKKGQNTSALDHLILDASSERDAIEREDADKNVANWGKTHLSGMGGGGEGGGEGGGGEGGGGEGGGPGDGGGGDGGGGDGGGGDG